MNIKGDGNEQNRIFYNDRYLVLKTLYATVQGNARAKKWEWVCRGAGRGEDIGNFQGRI